MDFNPINPAQSVVAQAKNNMGQLAPTLLLDRRGGRASWAGTFPLSADQLMAGERGPKATERIRCMVWLHNLLKKRGGGMKTEELRQLAHEQDHSKTTLYDARAALGITTKRIGLDLYWILPAQDHASLDNAISFENFRDENHSNSEHVGDDENLCPTQEPLTLSNFGNVKNSGNPGNFRNAVISSFPPLAPDELPLYSHSTLSSRSSDDSKDSGVPEFSLGHT